MAMIVDAAGQSDALATAHQKLAQAIDTARLVRAEVTDPVEGLLPLATAVEDLATVIQGLLPSKDA